MFVRNIIPALLAGVLIAAVAVGFVVSAAHAKAVHWSSTDGGWHVYADPDQAACLSIAVFNEDLLSVAIFRGPNGLEIRLSNTGPVLPDMEPVQLSTSDGYVTHLIGIPAEPWNGLQFVAVPGELIVHMIESDSLIIEHVANFNISDFRNSFLDLMACYRAMSGKPV